jgi:hypothetical protein
MNLIARKGIAITVIRYTYAKNGTDYSTDQTSTTISTGKKGLIADLSGFHNRNYDRKFAESTHLLIMNDIIELQPGDIVNTDYEVVYYTNPMGLNHHIEAELKKVK